MKNSDKQINLMCILDAVRVKFPDQQAKDIERRIKLWIDSCLLNTR